MRCIHMYAVDMCRVCCSSRGGERRQDQGRGLRAPSRRRGGRGGRRGRGPGGTRQQRGCGRHQREAVALKKSEVKGLKG